MHYRCPLYLQCTMYVLYSVMGKLPATSYVRMVDIWLIFTQLVPFIEDTTQTFNIIHNLKLSLSTDKALIYLY